MTNMTDKKGYIDPMDVRKALKGIKEFKVAHIVPVSCLKMTSNNQYHMCLAHLVSNDEYRQFFADMAKSGKFVLMDNGAAEGSQLSTDKLFEAYEKIQPTEIVLPDTLYEPGSTIEKARKFLSEMDKRGVHYRTMAVPQGRTLEEWEACARILVKDTRIDSIGVSKFLNIATQDRYVRFKACNILNNLIKEYGRYDLEVHLLGCDEGPLVVKTIQQAFPFIRGCDSAFSYLQAQANKFMSLEDDSRPAGTIDFIGGVRYDNLDLYIENFNQYAGIKNGNNGPDATWSL